MLRSAVFKNAENSQVHGDEVCKNAKLLRSAVLKMLKTRRYAVTETCKNFAGPRS